MVNERTSSCVGHLWLIPSKLARLMSFWMLPILLTKLGLPRKIYTLSSSNQDLKSDSKSLGDW